MVTFACQKKSDDNKPAAPRFASGTAAVEYLDSIVYGMKGCATKINEVKVGAELKDYQIEMNCGLKNYYSTIDGFTEIESISNEVLASGVSLSQKNYVEALVKIAQSTLPGVRAAHDVALAKINSIDTFQAYLTTNDYKLKVTLRLNANDFKDKTAVPSLSELLLILEAIERAGSETLNNSLLDEVVIVEKAHWGITYSQFEHSYQGSMDYYNKHTSSFSFYPTTIPGAPAVFAVSTLMIATSLNEVVAQLKVLPKRKDHLDKTQLTALLNKLNISSLSATSSPHVVTQLSTFAKVLVSVGLIFEKPPQIVFRNNDYNYLSNEGSNYLTVYINEKLNPAQIKQYLRGTNFKFKN